MVKVSLPGNLFWASGEEFRATILEELREKRVLLIMNRSNVKRLALREWICLLNQSSSVTWLDQVPSNPTYLDVFHSLSALKGKTPDLVVAIGGGSTIDLAKSCVGFSYLINGRRLAAEAVLDSLRTKEYRNHPTGIPIIAIPTTAGTGSEVTQWATVWDKEAEVKYSIDAAHLRPKRAYIVPEYTLSMPKRLTLSTGLDALCQAVEAYWAKASSPMVKELAKTALRLIVDHLPKVLSDPGNLYLREKVCLGSVFSGLAFSNTRTTACHSISYPLTMRYGVEHGLACALSLSKVMEVNLPAIQEAKELLAALGVRNAGEVQEWLDKITDGIVRLRLSSFGVQEKDIPKLVGMCFTLGRMDNNPVALTPGEVEQILRAIL